jgi:outer membrane protein assembly factor BamB
MDNVGESFLAGIDLKTGKNLWKKERPREINWVTPAVRTNGNSAEVIFQGGTELVAYDAATGERCWSFGGEGLSTIPSPLIGENNEVLTHGTEMVALKPGENGESPTVLWKSNKLTARGYPTPLYYKGRVFSLASSGILRCGDAKDGKVLWEERVKGPLSASPVAADGKIYVVSDNGATTVVEAGDKFKVLATNNLDDEILATPAIADGCLFLRSDKFLYCIGQKK